MRCQNCGREHGVEHTCLLGTLLGVLVDRGVPVEQIERALPHFDADVLWDRFGGPAVDWLEDQVMAVGTRVLLPNKELGTVVRRSFSPTRGEDEWTVQPDDQSRLIVIAASSARVLEENP